MAKLAKVNVIEFTILLKLVKYMKQNHMFYLNPQTQFDNLNLPNLLGFHW